MSRHCVYMYRWECPLFCREALRTQNAPYISIHEQQSRFANEGSGGLHCSAGIPRGVDDVRVHNTQRTALSPPALRVCWRAIRCDAVLGMPRQRTASSLGLRSTGHDKKRTVSLAVGLDNGRAVSVGVRAQACAGRWRRGRLLIWSCLCPQQDAVDL